MAEDIDIGNVGGQNGVASEATLVRLTASIEAMAKKAGIDPKAEAAKLQKLYNAQLGTTIPLERASGESKKDNTKATKESTKATINYGKAIKVEKLSMKKAIKNIKFIGSKIKPKKIFY